MKKKKEGVGTDNLKLGLEQDIQKSANNFACIEESIDFMRISNFDAVNGLADKPYIF